MRTTLFQFNMLQSIGFLPASELGYVFLDLLLPLFHFGSPDADEIEQLNDDKQGSRQNLENIV